MKKKKTMKVIYSNDNVLAFVKERKGGFWSGKYLGGDITHIKKIEMTFTKKYFRSS